jgi:hypothetical protein
MPDHRQVLTDFERSMVATNMKSVDPTIIKDGRINSIDWPYYFYPGP